MNTNEPETAQDNKWQERIWVLSVAGQAGLYVAFPVLIGMALGYLIDRQLGTYIVFAVMLSMAGFGAGIFLVYRWVKTTVHKHLGKSTKE